MGHKELLNKSNPYLDDETTQIVNGISVGFTTLIIFAIADGKFGLLIAFLGFIIVSIFLILIITTIASSFINRLISKEEKTQFKHNVSKLSRYKLLKISSLFFSSKTQKDTFEPTVADWDQEYFEALSKKEIWKARWINIRYTYSFIMAMWQKSPLGDLLEYVRKFAS